MSDIVQRLRSYLPLGDGSLWSQSSRDCAIAADTIEKLRVERDNLVLEMERARRWSLGMEAKRILGDAIERAKPCADSMDDDGGSRAGSCDY